MGSSFPQWRTRTGNRRDLDERWLRPSQWGSSGAEWTDGGVKVWPFPGCRRGLNQSQHGRRVPVPEASAGCGGAVQCGRTWVGWRPTGPLHSGWAAEVGRRMSADQLEGVAVVQTWDDKSLHQHLRRLLVRNGRILRMLWRMNLQQRVVTAMFAVKDSGSSSVTPGSFNTECQWWWRGRRWEENLSVLSRLSFRVRG